MNTTAISLLERLSRQPDGADWERFVGLYQPLLAKWAGRFGLQHEDVQEVIQEVLLVVLREIPEFRRAQRTGAFRAWLRNVLVHRVRELWRLRKHGPAGDGAGDFANRLDELCDERSGLSQLWNREHDQFLMNRLLDMIRPDFDEKTWEAFRQQVMDGDRADKVAEGLQISLSSAYVAKSRVLNRLRKEASGLIKS